MIRFQCVSEPSLWTLGFPSFTRYFSGPLGEIGGQELAGTSYFPSPMRKAGAEWSWVLFFPKSVTFVQYPSKFGSAQLVSPDCRPCLEEPVPLCILRFPLLALQKT